MNGEAGQLGGARRCLVALVRQGSRRCFGGPDSLSFALSVAILGFVFLMAAFGNQHASASTPSDDGGTWALATGQDHGSYVVLSESVAEGLLTGSGLLEASSPTLTLTILGHGSGSCTTCTASDSAYDPEMGFFTATLSGSFNGNVMWNRTPFVTNTFDLGPFNTSSPSTFQFWLHRSKGCGDFQIWGVDSSNQPLSNRAPFSVPCSGFLARDTVGNRWGDYSPGTFSPSPFDPTATDQTLYSEGPGSFAISGRNNTATTIQGNYLAPILTTPSFDPPLIVPVDNTERLMGPGDSGNFTFSLNPSRAWSPSAQSIGVAGASTSRVTATLVFSFGPTARITQTLIVARPDRLYAPVAARGLDSGW